MSVENVKTSVANSDAVVIALVKQLCCLISGRKNDDVFPYLRRALVTLGGNLDASGSTEELEVAETIKKKLMRCRREKDAIRFAELHRRLQSLTLLKERGSVLYLLSRLSTCDNPATSAARYRGISFAQGLSANYISTPLLPSSSLSSSAVNPSSGETTFRSAGQSSALSSIPNSWQRAGESRTLQSVSSVVETPFSQQALQTAADRTVPSLGLRLARSVTQSESSSSLQRHDRTLVHSSASSEVTEAAILKEVVFSLQGIAGTYVKYDSVHETFYVDPKLSVSKAIRQAVAKLVECGFLFSKVRKYADQHSSDRAFGLVGQSFCAALHQELTEYYRLIAVLAAQIQQEEDHGVIVCTSSSGLTLKRLTVWMCDPLVRLKTLAALVDVCADKKGGVLASTVHSYMQHGDPMIQNLVRHTLAVVAQPLYTIILRWIYEGELDDLYHEFFVASDPQVLDDRLWHDKYSLRTPMIPSFLTIDQARKILLTGKAINFLRQVCQDRTLVRSREAIEAAETGQVESMFSQDLDGSFDRMINTVYKETSRHLLHVLHTKYKFLDHLKALRRYLLLGQGDFIRHLMDLLKENLAKPAQTLFHHNLTSILETAIRATNAQFDDADILKRLDVRLLEVSPGDTGWDVFCLEYHVSGHIRTVFTSECMTIYLRVFNFLWRAKRMEYVLSMIWRDQMSNAKLLRSIPELGPSLHQCQLIVSEMMHFIQQIQYYINFEVLECSWDELLRRVKDADDLDHVIAAHEQFLDAITTRSLLDPNSHEILTQLRTIFDLIINFQTIEDTMYRAAHDELEARQNFEDMKTEREQQGEWGLLEDEEDVEIQRRAEFSKTVLSSSRSQLRVLQQSYQNMVQQFLTLLACHSDVSLRFLSFRLDFSEHYHSLSSQSRSSASSRRSLATRKPRPA